jgi:hypothetical protein
MNKQSANIKAHYSLFVNLVKEEGRAIAQAVSPEDGTFQI